MVRGVVLAAGCLAASVSCNSPADPSELDDLQLTVTISPSPIAPGQIATITFTLTNVGSETVNLTFNSGCQILPYIRVRSTNQILYPAGGDWACTAVVSQLSLRPGGTVQSEVRVRATDTSGTADAALAPGEYQALARLDDTRFRLESEIVSFVVQ